MELSNMDGYAHSVDLALIHWNGWNDSYCRISDEMLVLYIFPEHWVLLSRPTSHHHDHRLIFSCNLFQLTLSIITFFMLISWPLAALHVVDQLKLHLGLEMSYPYPSPIADGLQSPQVSANFLTTRTDCAPSFLQGWSHGILDLWFFIKHLRLGY
jgi:hypothetical protein